MACNTDLIAEIYDAVIEPSGWDGVVRRIVEATKSVGGVIVAHQIDALTHRAEAAHLTAICNGDPSYMDTYVQHYHKINPLVAHSLAVAPGEVATSTLITRTDRFRASPFFHEWLRPQGFADFVGIGPHRTPKMLEQLRLLRSPDAIWVEPKEWHLLETLAPHLRRAAAIQDLLSPTRAITESLGAAVAAAGFAAFLFTGDCWVLFANAKAEGLIRRGIGLRYERGRLVATSPGLTARLHALARHGSQPERGDGDIGGTLELPCGENSPPLVAHVIPLSPIRTVAIFDLDRPAAAVFIVDPAAGLGTQIQHFAARFGLTAGETRVLAEIIAGNGLVAAATKLKISAETARTHAKRILAKTGTARQTELIRSFFHTDFPGSPGGI